MRILHNFQELKRLTKALQITATQHLNVMNELNALLASAFDPYKSIFDNITAVLSLYISTWLLSSHYDRVRALLHCYIYVANYVGGDIDHRKV
jgi:hypothetical protein